MTPMPTRALCSILAALTAAMLLFISDILAAEVKPPVAEDARLLPYVEPGRLVDIGGRRINLRCSGAGVPAVILMAGSSSWSPVWYKTQPDVAKSARVCAFDRAS
jgi:hypothetical protein